MADDSDITVQVNEEGVVQEVGGYYEQEEAVADDSLSPLDYPKQLSCVKRGFCIGSKKSLLQTLNDFAPLRSLASSSEFGLTVLAGAGNDGIVYKIQDLEHSLKEVEKEILSKSFSVDQKHAAVQPEGFIILKNTLAEPFAEAFIKGTQVVCIAAQTRRALCYDLRHATPQQQAGSSVACPRTCSPFVALPQSNLQCFTLGQQRMAFTTADEPKSITVRTSFYDGGKDLRTFSVDKAVTALALDTAKDENYLVIGDSEGIVTFLDLTDPLICKDELTHPTNDGTPRPAVTCICWPQFDRMLVGHSHEFVMVYLLNEDVASVRENGFIQGRKLIDPCNLPVPTPKWKHQWFFEYFAPWSTFIVGSNWAPTISVIGPYSLPDDGYEGWCSYSMYYNPNSEFSSQCEVLDRLDFGLSDRPWMEMREGMFEDREFTCGMTLLVNITRDVHPWFILGDNKELLGKPNYTPPPTLLLFSSNGLLQSVALVDTDQEAQPPLASIPPIKELQFIAPPTPPAHDPVSVPIAPLAVPSVVSIPARLNLLQPPPNIPQATLAAATTTPVAAATTTPVALALSATSSPLLRFKQDPDMIPPLPSLKDEPQPSAVPKPTGAVITAASKTETGQTLFPVSAFGLFGGGDPKPLPSSSLQAQQPVPLVKMGTKPDATTTSATTLTAPSLPAINPGKTSSGTSNLLTNIETPERNPKPVVASTENNAEGKPTKKKADSSSKTKVIPINTPCSSIVISTPTQTNWYGEVEKKIDRNLSAKLDELKRKEDELAVRERSLREREQRLAASAAGPSATPSSGIKSLSVGGKTPVHPVPMREGIHSVSKEVLQGQELLGHCQELQRVFENVSHDLGICFLPDQELDEFFLTEVDKLNDCIGLPEETKKAFHAVEQLGRQLDQLDNSVVQICWPLELAKVLCDQKNQQVAADPASNEDETDRVLSADYQLIKRIEQDLRLYRDQYRRLSREVEIASASRFQTKRFDEMEDEQDLVLYQLEPLKIEIMKRKSQVDKLMTKLNRLNRKYESSAVSDAMVPIDSPAHQRVPSAALNPRDLHSHHNSKSGAIASTTALVSSSSSVMLSLPEARSITPMVLSNSQLPLPEKLKFDLKQVDDETEFRKLQITRVKEAAHNLQVKFAQSKRTARPPPETPAAAAQAIRTLKPISKSLSMIQSSLTPVGADGLKLSQPPQFQGVAPSSSTPAPPPPPSSSEEEPTSREGGGRNKMPFGMSASAPATPNKSADAGPLQFQQPSAFGQQQPSSSQQAFDLKSALTQFYQVVKPEKVSDVDKLAEKNKDKVDELLSKLTQVYSKDPYDQKPIVQQALGKLIASWSASSSSSLLPSSAAKPFGAGGFAPTNTTTPTAFGSGFGTTANNAPNQPPSSGGGFFGALTSTPSGGAARGDTGGKSAHYHALFKFYQQVNPKKMSELDDVLGRHQGREMEMWARLRERYPKAAGLIGSLLNEFGIADGRVAVQQQPTGTPLGFGGGFNSALPGIAGGGGNAFGTTPVAGGTGFGSFANAATSPMGGGFGQGGFAAAAKPAAGGGGVFGGTGSGGGFAAVAGNAPAGGAFGGGSGGGGAFNTPSAFGSSPSAGGSTFGGFAGAGGGFASVASGPSNTGGFAAFGGGGGGFGNVAATNKGNLGGFGGAGNTGFGSSGFGGAAANNPIGGFGAFGSGSAAAPTQPAFGGGGGDAFRRFRG